MRGSPDPYAELARRFGDNLRAERRRAGYSQEELGFLAELHRTEIGILERGIRLPRLDTLIKLLGTLEVEPNVLMAGVGWSAGNLQRGSYTVESAAPPDEPLGTDE